MARARGIRVNADTLASRFRWVLGASVVLHLVLTPVAGWVGLAALLLSQQQRPPAPPEEELNAIPVELLEDVPAAPGDAPAGLPEDDPVDVIEELIAVPETPEAPPNSTQETPEAKPDTDEAEAAAEREKREREQERLEEERRERERLEREREAEERRKELEEQRRLEEQRQRELAQPEADAGAEASREPVTKKPQRRAIDNPVAMVGKAGEAVESNAKLQLVLYADRIRKHPVGHRISSILPRLPQWKDFFGGTELDLVEDFDTLFVAGPSFYYSQHLFVALEYNTEREKVFGAIDRLVARRGRWLRNTPVPAAIAVADRAERLFVVPKQKRVFVAPPNLQKQAFQLSGRSLPRSSGAEAFVAFVKNPKKSFWQLGLDISETTHDAKIRLTPLPAGAVRVELTAQEDSEEAAQSTAHRVNKDINEKVEMLAGFSSVLSRFGFGGLGKGMKLPRIELRSSGTEIYGDVVLDADAVNFILDRVERFVVYAESQMNQAREAVERSAKQPAARDDGPASSPAGRAPPQPKTPGEDAR